MCNTSALAVRLPIEKAVQAFDRALQVGLAAGPNQLCQGSAQAVEVTIDDQQANQSDSR